MNSIKLSRQGRQLLSTNKHRAFVHVRTTVTVQGGWSGGSRYYATVYKWRNGTLHEDTERYVIVGDGFNVLPVPFTLAPDDVIIVAGTFQGQTATPVVYCATEAVAHELVGKLIT